MKTITFLTASMLLLFSFCNGQNKRKDKTETSTIHKQEKGQPEITIKVDKQYDKKGNLMSFDSTYTSYFEKKTADKALMDSLYKAFKSPFTDEFPVMKDDYFKSLFFNDSLIDNDFFHEDFFTKRFELNEEYMKRMMAQLDVAKNEYFKTKAKPIKK